MRPDLLIPLFASLGALPGVGPKIAARYAQLVGGDRVVDALWHMPTAIIDRRHSPKVMEATHGRVATIRVQVEAHLPSPPGSRVPYRIRCSDDTGVMYIVYFHSRKDWLRKTYPEGATVVASGTVEIFNGGRQMTHPDRITAPDRVAEVKIVEPIYALTAGISQHTAIKINKAARARVPGTPEWISPSMMREQAWQPWPQTLQRAHTPAEEADVSPLAPARMRLAYDELLANQLALMLARRETRRRAGRSLKGDGRLRKQALAALAFGLTGDQVRALDEIYSDMAAAERMSRLLQGDVGSGKTVVAMMAMLNAVETGAQAVLMAPTEILARQHMETLHPLAAATGTQIAELTGHNIGTKRQRLLERLAAGDINILVGTHAVFSQDVLYNDLALAVIDEQHRFGVQQRLKLARKGAEIDLLAMTATPIPRTLALTAYGDISASYLREKPQGRARVATRILPKHRMNEVVAGLRRAQRMGKKAYWVCPLVKESETVDTAAAEERYANLQSIFGDRVALAHGDMKPAAREAAMKAFLGDDVDILVATTVIEVGVHAPHATIMVIEDAERFGLAQLHQLRGRVGRGEESSSCLLLYGHPLTESGRARLEIVRRTDDGFVIAEEDLRLRGAGEVLGIRQSGLPDFRLADLTMHGELLAMARDDARTIINQDPELKTERGKALRVLLHLFERDSAVKMLHSG